MVNVGNLEARRDYTDVRDMVKAYYEVQDILLRDLPTIPVADRLQLNIIKDQFKGALTSTETYERLDEIWWVQGTPLKEGDFERD